MLTHLWISALIILSGWNCHTHPTSKPSPRHSPPGPPDLFCSLGLSPADHLWEPVGRSHTSAHNCHSTHHIAEQLSLSFWLCQSVVSCWSPGYNFYFWILRFSSVAQLCLTLCNPMNRSMPGLPVLHQFPESTQTHVHWVGDAIQPSHPLSSPSPPAFKLSQHQGLFKWVSSPH